MHGSVIIISINANMLKNMTYRLPMRGGGRIQFQSKSSRCLLEDGCVEMVRQKETIPPVSTGICAMSRNMTNQGNKKPADVWRSSIALCAFLSDSASSHCVLSRWLQRDWRTGGPPGRIGFHYSGLRRSPFLHLLTECPSVTSLLL